jgi:hypothetical protein
LWVWSRTKSDSDICPLVGATGALWRLSTELPPEPPPAEPVVVAAGRGWSETGDLATAGF